MLDDLPFKVEKWDQADLHVEEVLARAGNQIIAAAAFEAAVKVYPNARLTLRHGIRVMQKYPENL